MLISPLNAFPWVINGLVQAWVSLNRLQTFLNLENLNLLNYYSFNKLEINNTESLSIDVRCGRFSWNKNEELSINLHSLNGNRLVINEERNDSTYNAINQHEPSFFDSVLSDVDFKIKKGQLIGIIGKIGSGKTSLLHAIMGEIEKQDGEVRIDPYVCSKGFAYVGQDIWIRASSIKENILFGSRMDEAFYRKVIDACALNHDLEILPRGDETPVGENGICLSGGQKARLSLSRACYASREKDIYLLDDPLSAVDSNVAKHIYDHCITNLLADKTRIVCTHHFKYLTNADLVLVIDNGRIIKAGPGSQIIPEYMTDMDKIPKSSSKSSLTDSERTYMSLDEAKRFSKTNLNDDTLDNPIDETKLNEEEIKRQDEEEKEHGAINSKVYKYYCYAAGVILTILTLLSLFLMQGIKSSY